MDTWVIYVFSVRGSVAPLGYGCLLKVHTTLSELAW